MPIGDYALVVKDLRQRIKVRAKELEVNHDLTEDAKSRILAAEYSAVKKRALELREEHDRAVRLRRDALERDLFGTTGQSDGSEAIAFRDAIDRVDQISTEDQAGRLMRQASMTNDRTLQKALLFKAVVHNWDEVVTAYADHHPDVRSKVFELEDLIRDQSNIGKLGVASMFMVPKPGRLRSWSDRAIDAAQA